MVHDITCKSADKQYVGKDVGRQRKTERRIQQHIRIGLAGEMTNYLWIGTLAQDRTVSASVGCQPAASTFLAKVERTSFHQDNGRSNRVR
jgi:hypothetical protein